jgi:hypothetical protein
MGLQVDYLDDHRTDPAEEKRWLLWAEESLKEEEEFRDYASESAGRANQSRARGRLVL